MFVRRVFAGRELELRRSSCASTKIQSWFRQAVHTRQLKNQKFAACKMQALFRGRKGRVVAEQRKKEDDATTKIQSLWRMRISRQRYFETKAAAQKIVRFAKFVISLKAYHAARQLRMLRNKKACEMQRIMRGFLARKFVFGEPRGLFRLFVSARIIQAISRKFVKRVQFLRARQSAIKIQSVYRIRQSKAFLNFLRVQKLHSAASKIQKCFRSYRFWVKTMEHRERNILSFSRQGEVLFKGALRVQNPGMKGIFVVGKVQVFSVTGDLSVEMMLPKNVFQKFIVGNWFICCFSACLARCGKPIVRLADFAREILIFFTKLSYTKGDDRETMLQTLFRVKNLKNKEELVQLPKAFQPVERERAINVFWKSIFSSFEPQPDTRMVSHEKSKEIGKVEEIITAINQFEDSENGSEEFPSDGLAAGVLEKLDQCTPEFAYARALSGLGKSRRGMFNRIQRSSSRRVVALTAVQQNRPGQAHVFAEDWTNSVFSSISCLRNGPKSTEVNTVEATPSPAPFDGRVLKVFADSFSPDILFQFDMIAQSRILKIRIESLKALLQVEDDLLDRGSSKTADLFFNQQKSDLEKLSEATQQKRSELLEDLSRWNQSLELSKRKIEMVESDDVDSVEFFELEEKYLKLKVTLALDVVRKYDETLKLCQEEAEFISESRNRFTECAVEIKFLIESGRAKRSRWVQRQMTALDQGIPLFKKCQTLISQLTGAMVIQHFRSMGVIEYGLRKFLGPVRFYCEEMRVCEQPLFEMVEWHTEAVQASAHALEDFLFEISDELQSMAGLRLAAAHTQDRIAQAAIEEIQLMEKDVVKTKESYDRKKAADEQMKKILHEEEEEYRIQAEFEQAIKPKVGRERLEELEEDLKMKIPGFLDEKFRTLIRAVDFMSTGEEQMGFEARQVEFAHHRFKALVANVEEMNIPQAIQESQLVIKRLRASIYLFKDLQQRYEKLQHQNEGRALDSSESDSESDWSDSSSGSEGEGEQNIAYLAMDTLDEIRDAVSTCKEYRDYAEEMIGSGQENSVPETYLRNRVLDGGKSKEDDSDIAQKAAYLGTTATGRVLRRLAHRTLGEKYGERASNSWAMEQIERGAYGVNKAVHFPGRAARRMVILGVARKERLLIELKEKTKKIREDPFGKVALRQNESAIQIQRIARGWLTRHRIRNAAALIIQSCVRNWLARRHFVEALYRSTVKYYDFASDRYYYVWLGKSSWTPPPLLDGKYIKFGKRRRPRDYEWTVDEAASVLQSVYRRRVAQRYFVELIHQSFEKVYEPSRGAYFYQNIYNGHCQWHKPVGLPEPDDIQTVFVPKSELVDPEEEWYNYN